MRTALLLALLLTWARAIPALASDQLTGTLKKVHDTGSITIGYRESSIPFSYLDSRGQPIGYAIDLCQEIIDDVSAALDGLEVKVAYRPVTPKTRIPALLSGDIDLECGSTTSNNARQKQVAFSPIFFIAGTKLLVERDSPISSYRDLRDKAVVVTAGTTNEAALRAIDDKQKLGIKFITTRDQAEALAKLRAGLADAFASDDVLLHGLIAAARVQSGYKVVGEYLSYDPYGLMFRKNDRDFAEIVDQTFKRLAENRGLVAIYNKWFLNRLPSGERLALPMSPQLMEMFQALGLPD